MGVRKRWVTGGAILLGLCGCNPANPPERVTVEQLLEHPVADPPRSAARRGPSAPPADVTIEEQPLAWVNDRRISRQQFAELLERSHGLFVLEQLVALEVVRSAAQRQGVTVDDGDIRAEYDRAVDAMALQAAPEHDARVRSRAGQQVLQTLLDEKRISAEEFRLSTERNAYLRKMAESQVQVTDAEVRMELERRHGRQAVCRLMVLPDLRTVTEVRRRLDRGEDFAELTAAYSTQRVTAALGGLLPPFARQQEQIPEALRAAAFALSPGGTSSAIRIGGDFHLLRLERFIESGTQTADNPSVAQVRSELADRRIRSAMHTLEQELFEQSTIRITDPELRDQFRRRHP